MHSAATAIHKRNTPEPRGQMEPQVTVQRLVPAASTPSATPSPMIFAPRVLRTVASIIAEEFGHLLGPSGRDYLAKISAAGTKLDKRVTPNLFGS